MAAHCAIAAQSANDMLALYKHLFHLGFGSGNLFLTMPFPDNCLLFVFLATREVSLYKRPRGVLFLAKLQAYLVLAPRDLHRRATYCILSPRFFIHLAGYHNLFVFPPRGPNN